MSSSQPSPPQSMHRHWPRIQQWITTGNIVKLAVFQAENDVRWRTRYIGQTVRLLARSTHEASTIVSLLALCPMQVPISRLNKLMYHHLQHQQWGRLELLLFWIAMDWQTMDPFEPILNDLRACAVQERNLGLFVMTLSIHCESWMSWLPRVAQAEFSHQPVHCWLRLHHHWPAWSSHARRYRWLVHLLHVPDWTKTWARMQDFRRRISLGAWPTLPSLAQPRVRSLKIRCNQWFNFWHLFPSRAEHQLIESKIMNRWLSLDGSAMEREWTPFFYDCSQNAQQCVFRKLRELHPAWMFSSWFWSQLIEQQHPNHYWWRRHLVWEWQHHPSITRQRMTPSMEKPPVRSIIEHANQWDEFWLVWWDFCQILPHPAVHNQTTFEWSAPVVAFLQFFRCSVSASTSLRWSAMCQPQVIECAQFAWCQHPRCRQARTIQCENDARAHHINHFLPRDCAELVVAYMVSGRVVIGSSQIVVTNDPASKSKVTLIK